MLPLIFTGLTRARLQVIATVIIGMCLGWAFGAAAMRAALASRNQLVLKSSLQRELQRCVTRCGMFSTFTYASAVLQGWRTQTLFSQRTSSQGSSWIRGELFTALSLSGSLKQCRSTVVFGCFLGLANMVFALIRCYAPKLILMSVFGSIAVDIFCVSVHPNSESFTTI